METCATGTATTRRGEKRDELSEANERSDHRGYTVAPRTDLDEFAGDMDRAPSVTGGRSLGRILRDKN